MPTTPTQRVIASLELPEYKSDKISGLREGYSVYKIKGESAVLESYEVIVSFVSDEPINIEDIT
ncbi:MAG: hypothetical protein WC179_09050, partial [Candidatus Cloacimonadaceae bacterium]